MATSVIDIDVNSEEFAEFQKAFNTYNAALAKMPAQWKQVNAVLAQSGAQGAAAIGGITKQTTAATKQTSAFAKAWGTVGKATNAVNKSLQQTGSLISRLIPALGPLGLGLGAGALVGLPALGFGLFSALQGTVGASRTRATSIGVSIGREEAFNNVYNRYGVDDGTLSNLAAMKADRSKWGDLAYASKSDAHSIASMDPTQLFQKIADNIRATTNPQAQLSLAQRAGLSVGQLNSITSASNAEWEERRKTFADRTSRLGIADKDAEAAQTFMDGLKSMGLELKNTVFRDLIPLQPALTSLTSQVNKTLNEFLGSNWVKEHLKTFGHELDEFAHYLASPAFKKDVQDFQGKVTDIMHALGRIADFINKWFPDSKSSNTDNANNSGSSNNSSQPSATTGSGAPYGFGGGAQTSALPNSDLGGKHELGLDGKQLPETGVLGWVARKRRDLERFFGFNPSLVGGNGSSGDSSYDDQNSRNASTRGLRNNNPLNLGFARQAGAQLETGVDKPRFARFDSMGAGIRAADKQLQTYASRDGLKTIEQMISKWAPSSENDTKGYIAELERSTGFKKNDKLDMSNAEVRAILEAAMAKRESGRDAPDLQQIRHAIIVDNRTGSDVSVTAATVAH